MTTIATTNGIGRAPIPNGHRTSQGQPSVLQMLREADAADRARAAQAESPATNEPQKAHTTTAPFGGFSAEQIAALTAPLDRAHISSREQGRGQVPYLKSYVVINEANRIFGFDGWQRQTLFSRCIAQSERSIGREQKKGWGVTYIARVRITVSAGGHGPLIREGTGAGHGIDTDLGLAHESAIKEAETDATKRAVRRH
jgi:recombination DNA repair RAD52 pathway protein